MIGGGIKMKNKCLECGKEWTSEVKLYTLPAEKCRDCWNKNKEGEN